MNSFLVTLAVIVAWFVLQLWLYYPGLVCQRE
jgi:hypothetical protein